MGTKDNGGQGNQTGKDPSFDDFEDAFFASGDASSFYDKDEAAQAAAKALSEESEEGVQKALEEAPTIHGDPEAAQAAARAASPSGVTLMTCTWL